MNSEKLKGDFDRDGFVIIEPLFDADALRELRENVDRYRTQVAAAFPEGHEGAMYGDIDRRPESMIRMNKMHESDDYFRDLPHRDPWDSLVQTFLGESVTTANVVWFNKPPASTHPNHPSPPHQDNFYYHLDPAQMMTLWVPLEPVDADNGCLRYVAGSHLKGLRSHTSSSIYGFSQGISDYGPDDWAAETRICIQSGDAVAHHCMTIHRADANESPTRSRPAMAMLYLGASAKVDEAWRARHLEQVRKQQAALGRKLTV